MSPSLFDQFNPVSTQACRSAGFCENSMEADDKALRGSNCQRPRMGNKNVSMCLLWWRRFGL